MAVKDSEVSRSNVYLYNITRKETIYLVAIIALGIFLRWFQLDLRPFHHDESLFAIYGRYFFENPDGQFYRYDPMLNGPLLYHLLPLVYQMFGVSEWSARVLPALLGSLFLFLPLFFKRYLRRHTLLLATTLLALSPSLIYWSRFLRHEYLVLSSIFLMIWGITCARGHFRMLWVTLGLTLQFCIKENAYVTTIMLMAYLLFEWAFQFFCQRAAQPSLIKKIFNTITKVENVLAILGSIGICYFLYAYLYGAGFSGHFPDILRYPQGIADGLFRKSIPYWFNQHSIERISGPFSFHLFFLSWYELVFMLILVAHIIHFYRRASLCYKITFTLAVLASVVIHLTFRHHDFSTIAFYRLFKLKLSIDVYFLLLLVTHAINTTVYHLRQKEDQLAFWSFAFYANLFAYSYAGEKVPWLSIYPLTMGMVYLMLYCQRHDFIQKMWEVKFPKTAVPMAIFSIVIIISFNFYISVLTCFTQAGSQTEFISQVHTTADYEKLVMKLKDQMTLPTDARHKQLLSLGEAWPISWYLKNVSGYFYYRPENMDINSFDYLWYNPESEPNPPPANYNRTVIPLRGWWVPDYTRMNILNYFYYSLTHRPWSVTGTTNVIFFSKKTVDPLLNRNL
ncbi:MAG: flippase activity-associated protein Agl23 [Pseudomonadota bacterium]